MSSIDRYNDMIDSRDLEEAIEELQGELEGVEYNLETEQYEVNGVEMNSEYEELEKLIEFAQAFKESSSDYPYGAVAIRDTHFKEYAQEMAQDIGIVNNSSNMDAWPLNCIDWDQAAEQLKGDYTPIEFEDITYWVR